MREVNIYSVQDMLVKFQESLDLQDRIGKELYYQLTGIRTEHCVTAPYQEGVVVTFVVHVPWSVAPDDQDDQDWLGTDIMHRGLDAMRPDRTIHFRFNTQTGELYK